MTNNSLIFYNRFIKPMHSVSNWKRIISGIFKHEECSDNYHNWYIIMVFTDIRFPEKLVNPTNPYGVTLKNNYTLPYHTSKVVFQKSFS